MNDRHAVLEGLAGHEVLPSRIDVALDHHAHDAPLAFRELADAAARLFIERGYVVSRPIGPSGLRCELYAATSNAGAGAAYIREFIALTRRALDLIAEQLKDATNPAITSSWVSCSGPSISCGHSMPAHAAR